MAYKTSNTTCRVQLVAYRRLSAATAALCAALRQEAGRCWSDLVAAHLTARDQHQWLSDADLRTMTKGGTYALHSQSIQALGQQLLVNPLRLSETWAWRRVGRTLTRPVPAGVAHPQLATDMSRAPTLTNDR